MKPLKQLLRSPFNSQAMDNIFKNVSVVLQEEHDLNLICLGTSGNTISKASLAQRKVQCLERPLQLDDFVILGSEVSDMRMVVRHRDLAEIMAAIKEYFEKAAAADEQVSEMLMSGRTVLFIVVHISTSGTVFFTLLSVFVQWNYNALAFDIPVMT
ncbi:hypothetical protein RHGRI_034404 [Rhododendron griersonianum]|uniref:Uncharacterized protein n=1 Tax=Rhododendron griersonianum TaxID=479676 RepID=A0AAV6I541_9ERIC|nr:hypothetical protein RHGRI_034404 [Rhododendron griersonianum]